MAEVDRVTSPAAMPEVYAAVAARRSQFDSLLWQVPVLTITAQAFLFTISLGSDTQAPARIISCLLSLLITFLTLQLFARHRQAEVTDAHWLEDYERHHYGSGQAHGVSWQRSRNQIHPDAGLFSPFARLPGFKTWSIGLSLFGVTAIAILIVSIFWPQVLQH